MSQPTTFRFGAFVFFLGDGASPTEAFTRICGGTEMELEMTAETQDTTVPNCLDPNAAVFVEREVTSRSWQFTFTGLLAADARPLLLTAYQAPNRNFRLHLVGAGTGGGTPDLRYSGNGIITANGISTQRGPRATQSLTIVGNGALAVAAVAALA